MDGTNDNNNTLKFWIKNYLGSTLSDGNCLYSAIFRSLKYKDKLHLFNVKSYGLNKIIDITDEKKFISSFRNFMADTYMSKNWYNDNVKPLLKNFVKNKKFYSLTAYKNVSEHDENDIKTMDKNIESIKILTKKNGTWACDVDMNIIVNILELINIGFLLFTEDDVKQNLNLKKPI